MKIRVSIATASLLGLKNYIVAAQPTTLYFMLPGDCKGQCLYCTHREGYLSRVKWPEFDMEEVRLHAPTMEISPDSVSAEWVFDNGFATWAGITPDDVERRNRERAEILRLAKTDMPAYLEVMKRWGKDREKRFQEQGWRKMR